MFSFIKEHQNIFYGILCIPAILILLAIYTNIIFPIGIYFGTIARHVSEGICCF